MSHRVVIVTGGAQGIGLGISQAFGRCGARVVMADRDAEAGRETAHRLCNEGLDIRFVQTDVSVESDVVRLVDDVVEGDGRIDVVVNNAGIFSHEPIESLPVAVWDKVIGVNLRGPFLMAKYCAPYLRQADPGNIINIASTRALMSEAHTEPYSASKGGIVALTHALAVSLGPDVRVNAVSPGWIEVSDWKKSSRRAIPEHRPEDLAQHPVGRVGTPHDIAQACVYLASLEASFITGQNLVIDGGMTVKMIYEE
ncbi:glucose 1-dehydrogenase [Alicyclobacillus dauci]|uniref:Glucose 1-dehydrogenase n=1 Tax=Alicyclobacillus dauci TaxID=1475485 RepID=A0ABY6Z0U6_9BACL|nr:glucose 1-dehydrogenase [Alicyclobacillus dauci]WAH36495.1 glucose 1-dehydrogenase [Alicyclobacillus dauci]